MKKVLLTFIVLISTSVMGNPSKDNLPKVFLEKFQKQEVYRFGEYYGRVRPQQETKIFSPISGTFEVLNVKPGQKVKKNQILAKIKAIDFANEMRPMSIRAPFNGIIAGPLPTVGQFINKHQLVLNIYKNIKFISDIDMAYEDAQHLQNGHKTTIEINGEKYDGNILSIGQQIDSVTGTVRCEIVFKNEHNKLRPGSISKNIIKYNQRQSFAIPRKYIHRNGKNQVVYTIETNKNKENKLVAIPIEVNGRFKDLLEIKLQKKENELTIVTKSTLKHLSEGKKVEQIKPKTIEKKTNDKKSSK